MPQPYIRGVFINAPFDQTHWDLFHAMVFTVMDCGFSPRCALEAGDGSQVRIEKLFCIIEDCRLGIHDISYTALDPVTGLPRFNMPLELGLFLAAKRFGGSRQRRKNCLVLDAEPYRYQKFISDIAGQDIRSHQGRPRVVVQLVRNWLRNADREKTMPSDEIIWSRYESFRRDLPLISRKLRLREGNMIFNDFVYAVADYIQAGTAL
jgi:hypothetical protein